MFMRIFLVVAAIFTGTAGTSPTASCSGLQRCGRKPGRKPVMKERDAIVTSMFLAHPGWTSRQILHAITPLIAAANLPPISLSVLSQQLIAVAKEHKIRRTWGGMKVEYTSFLRHQFATDPTQSTRAVWDKFCNTFGAKAEKTDRVTRWWRRFHQYHSPEAAAGGGQLQGQGSPRRTSPTTLRDTSDGVQLPLDWWDLNAEVASLIGGSGDAASATDTGAGPSPAGSPLQLPRTHYRNPNIMEREAIVESVLVANPTWTARQVLTAASRLIAAAGLRPIGLDGVKHQVCKMARAHNIKRGKGGMRPEYTAFLAELYRQDPNQLAGEVVTKFKAKWGPDAESAHRVTVWWYNAQQRSRRKQAKQGLQSGTGAVGSPLSPLPSGWWNLDDSFDSLFKDGGNGVSTNSELDSPHNARR